MKDLHLAVYSRSITVGEHRQLRAAVSAAQDQGETTYLCDGAGFRIAKIVPLEDGEQSLADPGRPWRAAASPSGA